MAVRPAWSIKNDRVIQKDFEFVWNSGLNIKQKQKNIDALHNSISESAGGKALEISSKGRVELGVSLSAFNLEFHGVKLENVFQASKNYEGIGTNSNILTMLPKEAKAYVQQFEDKPLKSFVFEDEEWPLLPRTAFYDYIYISAVIENYGYDLNLSEYDWFTDIEFNPKKSLNCQARALAIYKLLQARGDFTPLKGKDEWIAFHQSILL